MTSERDRADILAALVEDLRDTLEEWCRRSVVEREGSRLEGQELYLSWQEDGTVSVQLPRYTEILRVAVGITVEPVEVANEPIGPEISTTWAQVPSGWFVKTPKGDWLEVTDTHLDDPRGQFVGLRVNGQVSHWHRPPKGEVRARRGSQAPEGRDEAMRAFGESFQMRIISDGGPMQS